MPSRIQSIDVFRGLTMLLMVWVNDFWRLSDIPAWLKHMPADQDALGFSDTIFPAFLFIVGLSIPFANRSRRDKGEARSKIALHISIRSLSLLVMGVLMVNLESYDGAASLFPRWFWQIAMATGFFLIWNDYPKSESWAKRRIYLQTSGWLILGILATTFRSGAGDGYYWLEPRWWGILGLIGWSYLLCSLLQLFTGESVRLNAYAWLGLVAFNIAAFAGFLDFLSGLKRYVWIVGDGALPALTMAGCLVSTLYRTLSQRGELRAFSFAAVGLGVGCVVAGILLRPYWGISKIHATPAWTEICTGLSVLGFAAIFWVVDIMKWAAWARFLKPAGVATLTCYLLPYIVYPIMERSGLSFPEAMTSGVAGLCLSMGFALAIVWLTGLCCRFGIKIRL